jgi:hypothetical protein
METSRNISRREGIVKLLTAVLGVRGLQSELTRSLTHYSFYDNHDDDRSNSRFVFNGMFGFKGEVANLAIRLMPGNGKQLQYFLGNIFASEKLKRIFDRYQLGPLCRFGKGFDIEKHKHIMVYGFMGFVSEFASEAKLERFIMKNFFEGNSHLFPGFSHNRDLLAQLTYFSRMTHNRNPVLKTLKKGETYQTIVSVNGSEIVTAESMGFRHSRKKAMKTALLFLSAPLAGKLASDDAFLEREAQRAIAEKEKMVKQKMEKAEKYSEKQQKKLTIRSEKRVERRKQAIEREIMRRRAKMRAKARAESIEKKLEKEQAALARMSADKRRHLQDKKK